jgi:RHS repeat-associated protein
MSTTAQLSENSHQGSDRIKAALCLGSMEAKSNTASGMPLCLWQEGIRSRCSGKERDAETGLDYFGARYFSGTQGRFASPDPLMLSVERLLDPQGLNLYSYTRNRPLIAVDDGGLATILVLVGSNQNARIYYMGNDGTIKGYNGLARGTSRDRSVENGDTPFGKYQVMGTLLGKLGESYGKGSIDLKREYGEKANRDVDSIAVHGGGKSRRVVPNPYSDEQPLINTFGCVRMRNKDVVQMIRDLRAEGNYGDDHVYIGNKSYMKEMAIRGPYWTGDPTLQGMYSDYGYDPFFLFDIIIGIHNGTISTGELTGSVSTSCTITLPDGRVVPCN